jgi:hypothetical protein
MVVDQVLGPVIISVVLFTVVLVNFIVRGTYPTLLFGRMIAHVSSPVPLFHHSQ